MSPLRVCPRPRVSTCSRQNKGRKSARKFRLQHSYGLAHQHGELERMRCCSSRCLFANCGIGGTKSESRTAHRSQHLAREPRCFEHATVGKYIKADRCTLAVISLLFCSQEWSTALAARAQKEADACDPPSTAGERSDIIPGISWVGSNRLVMSNSESLSEAVRCWYDAAAPRCTSQQQNQVRDFHNS